MKRYQSPAEVVKLCEELRVAAAGVVALTFDERKQSCVERVPGLHRFLVTRSVKGDPSSPLCRLAWWCVALSLAGGLELAQLLVDFLQDVVDLLAATSSRAVSVISLAEQLEEGHETYRQQQYSGGNKSIRREWINHLRRERALSGELIRALEAEEAAESFKVAA